MIEIIPAILPPSLGELREQLSRIRGATRDVQIDIVDGIFASNRTWPYAQDGRPETRSLKDELAFADAFDIEVDLMAHEPEDMAESWRESGAARIIIHADTAGAREALLALTFEREEHKKPQGIAVGIALPCSASAGSLAEFENLYDFVQVMGIDKVGFQGQPFASGAIELVRALRQQYPDLAIQVDGGVSEKNIPDLVRAGANRLIVGSQIWKSENPKAEIQTLEALANSTLGAP